MEVHILRCVERNPDYLDSLVFVALLQSRNIDALLFDENVVRQNWLEILAYGGFRIMVPGRDLQRAHELLTDFRNGTLRCEEVEREPPNCPVCHAPTGEFDHRQRGWVFLAWFFYGLVLTLLAIVLDDPVIPYFVLSCLSWWVLLNPALLRFVVNDRLRCTRCLHAWRELPHTPFARQQQNVEDALNQESS